MKGAVDKIEDELSIGHEVKGACLVYIIPSLNLSLVMAKPIQNHQFYELDHEESSVNGSVMGPQMPEIAKGVDRFNLINRLAMCREQF